MAKAAGIPVLATDIDPVAVDAARANCRANCVPGRVRIVQAAGTNHAAFRTLGPFDLIIANILAAPLADMAPSLFRVAAPGATLILSGLLPEHMRRIVATYRNIGFRLMDWLTVDGWRTVIVGKPGREYSSGRDLSLEPFQPTRSHSDGARAYRGYGHEIWRRNWRKIARPFWFVDWLAPNAEPI